MSISCLKSQVIQILKRSSAQDFVLTAGSNAAIAFFGTVGGVLAARLLGTEGRGALAAATVWAGILSTLACLGLPQALTYFSAREPAQVGAIFAMTLAIWMVQSIAILLIGWLGTALFFVPSRLEAALAVRVYLFSIPCSLMITYLSTMAQGLGRFRLFNGFRVVSASTYMVSLLIALFLNWHAPLKIVISMLIMQAAVAAGVFCVFIIKIRPNGCWECEQAKSLLRYGLRSYWGSLSWMANARLDQFIMSAYVSLAELGIYAVAVSYATVLFPLSGAFAMVLFPQVAGADRDDALAKIKRTLGLSLLVSAIGAMVLGLACPLLLPWLFGTEFRPAVYPAMVLLGGTVILGANYVLSDGLRGLGHPLVTSLAEVIGLFITLVGLLWLLPKIGIVGAAWTSLCSYFFVLLILLYGIFAHQHPEKGGA